MKIKKNDTVKIIAGKDKGKTGKVIAADPRNFSALGRSASGGKVTVEGLNLYKKHVRPKRSGEKGQVISVPRPLPVSNVMLMCGSCGQPVRVGRRIEADKKVRYCKKCKAII